ncbi:hypothetical protein DNTS_002168 [Danionella cerebrum]|uniref:RCC1 domain-containing protein 1 n=1 Tax=Danionella cerebrum TaxID=2873325 RepID=A0A553R1F9_9TELE|nr:hypothetical protein DNTS_002168 [Danionella translucida]
MSGCWFGFGFNGFGQICPVESGGQAKVKVSTPELLVSASDCGVKGSWSSRADLHHATCHSEVHLSGFASGSSEIISASSQGCTDALISECFLVLSFTDRVEIWEIQEPQNTRQIWKREHRATDQNDCSLPLVPGGYILPKSPFFRTLSADLCGVSLVLGSEHALLLTAAGMLYSWGSGSHGQLGHGALTSHEDPQVLEALWGVPIRTVAAGNWHSAAVSTGGDLYMWGWNESGQLGLPSRGLEEGKRKTKHSGNSKQPGNEDEQHRSDVFISIQAFPALVDIANVSEISRISCGSRHTAAVTSAGELYTWGWGEYGQLGHGSESSTDEPELVEYFCSHKMSVTDVVCGLWSTYVSVRSEK